MAKKALIAMSGGVDSSVAAYLMLQRGYDCTGVTLRLFDNPQENPDEKTCCSLDSTEDARSVCRRLGIPFFVYNFTESFENAVIKRFVSAYENGSTPNPCIDCNRYIKFEKLLRHAEELGFDCVVTGHYATVAYDAASGRYLLKKSVDTGKDQSYVLYPLTQAQLAKTVFPLGEMTKEQTRAIAEEQGFVNAHKHDSQDICFVPDGDYARFRTAQGHHPLHRRSAQGLGLGAAAPDVCQRKKSRRQQGRALRQRGAVQPRAARRRPESDSRFRYRTARPRIGARAL